MTEEMKHALDKGKKVGTIFMVLFKAFDALNHNLWLVKLNVYSFFSMNYKICSKLFVRTISKDKYK